MARRLKNNVSLNVRLTMNVRSHGRLKTNVSEKGGAAAAVTALTAKAKLAGMWREKVDQHNTGNPVYERIERVIVERPQSAPNGHGDATTEAVTGIGEPSQFTEVIRDLEMPRRHWSI